MAKFGSARGPKDSRHSYSEIWHLGSAWRSPWTPPSVQRVPVRLIPTRFCGRWARRWNEQAAELVDEETAKSMRNKRHHFCRCHVKGGKRLRAEFAQVRAMRLRAPALKIAHTLSCRSSIGTKRAGRSACSD